MQIVRIDVPNNIRNGYETFARSFRFTTLDLWNYEIMVFKFAFHSNVEAIQERR